MPTTTLYTRLRLKLLHARSSLQQPLPAKDSEPRNTRPGTRSFLRRITPATLAAIPAHLASLAPRRSMLERRARAKRELSAFAGDPDRLLASVALTCRPATLRTKAAILAATFPELREKIRPHAEWAQMRLAMTSGRTRPAATFAPSAFARACRDFPDQTVARACRVLWVTASRAADLKHFKCEQIAAKVGLLWKIVLEVVAERGVLRAPKGSQNAKRSIVKWIPVHPEFDPRGLGHLAWEEIDPLMKTIGCTPHSIRQTASRFLENQGFSEVERAALTGHAISGVIAPGIRSYSTGSWADAQSLLAIRQARILMEALSC